MEREALQAETRLYEAAERRIEHWAFERRRQEEQRERFFAERRRIRSTNKPDNVNTAAFHGTKQETRKQRIERERREELERELDRKQRKQARDADLRARRGRGPVRRCTACQTIYRGVADTCGCKPCAHCGKSFRGDSFKCESCKSNPDLITARGTETRSNVPRREAQPSMTPLSHEALRIEGLLDELPQWMAEAIDRRYRLKETDHTAAENLMIPVPMFAARCRAAVARVAELLANRETARV
jgi:hypothetical protein